MTLLMNRKFQRRENAKNKNRTLQTFKRYRLVRIAIFEKVRMRTYEYERRIKERNTFHNGRK